VAGRLRLSSANRMTIMPRIFLILFCLMASAASAKEPVFDMHVHLRDGEASLREYQEDVAASGIKLSGDVLERLGLTPEEKARIRLENARRIFGR